MSFLLVSAPHCVLSGGFGHRTWMALALERPDCSGSSGFTWSFGGFSAALVWSMEGKSANMVWSGGNELTKSKWQFCTQEGQFMWYQTWSFSIIICGEILSEREVELMLEKLGKATFNCIASLLAVLFWWTCALHCAQSASVDAGGRFILEPARGDPRSTHGAATSCSLSSRVHFLDWHFPAV